MSFPLGGCSGKGGQGVPVFKDEDYLRNLEKRAEEARLVRKIVFFIVIAIIVVFLAVAGGGYYYVHSALQPANSNNHKKVKVDIPLGSSVSDIAHRLQQKGVIKSALVFHIYVKYKNDNGFQAGHYLLSPSMSINKIINDLQKGRSQATALKLTFPEGLWMTDVADIIAANTNLNKQEILAKMKDRAYIKKTYMKDYPFLKKVILKPGIRYPLEGYLFPATYSFTKKNPSLDTIIRKMLNKTQAVLQEYQPQIAKSKKSVHQILTIASMIQKESVNKLYRRGISSVFYNRLKKGMPLQSDPTVDYAVHKHHVQLAISQLSVKSPYNTYANKGLPIGPIANPGQKAIQAALNPLKTDDLYFYARPNGKVEFAKTYSAFLQIKNKYQGEWAKYKKNKQK